MQYTRPLSKLSHWNQGKTSKLFWLGGVSLAYRYEMGDLWLSLAHTLAPLALSVTLCHSLALSGSLWSLILLTRPLVSSQRRCHADALYSSLALVSFFLKKNKICWLYFSGGNTRIGRKFKILVRFQLCRIARQVWLPAGTSCPTIVSAFHLLSILYSKLTPFLKFLVLSVNNVFLATLM